MQDNKITGEQNRLAILKWLHRFGWLTSRQIAELVWADKKSALAMAQKTIATMLESKLIIKRKLDSGSEAILLSSKGASMLNTELNVKAVSGAKLKLGNATHRCASNYFLIQELAKGNAIFTEHEIQTGKSPVSACYGKIPDGLVIYDQGVFWLEVENSWKNINEREKIVQFCADISSQPQMIELWHNHFLYGVKILAITAFSAEAIVRTFAKFNNEGLITDSALADIDLTYAPMTSGLIYANATQVKNFHILHNLIRPYNMGVPVKFNTLN